MYCALHRALTVAGLLLLPVSIALAQPGGAVRGLIVDELGRPIAEATVVVNSFGAAETTETQTTSDGQYTYTGMAAGLYTITATKDELGGEVFRIRVRDGHTVSVNFELAPGRRVASYLVEAGEREALSRTFAAGIEASRSGNYDVAVDAFQSALDLSPTCLECHYNLAIAYTELGRFADAEEEFRSVLRLREDYAAAYYGLSSIYTRQGRTAEAADARTQRGKSSCPPASGAGPGPGRGSGSARRDVLQCGQHCRCDRPVRSCDRAGCELRGGALLAGCVSPGIRSRRAGAFRSPALSPIGVKRRVLSRDPAASRRLGPLASCVQTGLDTEAGDARRWQGAKSENIGNFERSAAGPQRPVGWRLRRFRPARGPSCLHSSAGRATRYRRSPAAIPMGPFAREWPTGDRRKGCGRTDFRICYKR